MKYIHILLLVFTFYGQALATTYEVGPSMLYISIGDVPWELMQAGDTVFIHYRSTPYYEKWVINVAGTAQDPFVVMGVSGPGGELPIISGDGAITRTQLNYWNEDRSVIKIGGSSVPQDGMPSHIVIANLEIRSGHVDYTFTDDAGNPGQSYIFNAASIFVEKVDHLTIRNCELHDSGNGLFIAHQSNDILIEGNYIHDNGNVGRFLEHNSYTEAENIVFQYNRYGPLRPGADGNNLKDRSAGTVIRYNWIRGGNRLMDLVESSFASINTLPSYRKTYVYGNVLTEEDGGNNQVIHYGGDNGNTADYRKGDLYFYNNTLYSIRAGNTTLVRLSSANESADIRNNILHVTADGNRLAILESSGMADFSHNMLKPGYVVSHNGSSSAILNDDNTSITVADPLFADELNGDFTLLAGSDAIDAGTSLHADVLPTHDVTQEYVMHQEAKARNIQSVLDIGAYEYQNTLAIITGSAFSGSYTSMGVELTWSTLAEINTDHFLVYRLENGEWKEHGKVMARGNPYSEQLYRLMDRRPLPGENWYKLVEVDYDQMLHEIGITKVANPTSETTIYPNPARDILYFAGDDFKRYDIMDLAGRIITNGAPVDNQIILTDLPPGQYMVRLTSTVRMETHIFTKL